MTRSRLRFAILRIAAAAAAAAAVVGLTATPASAFFCDLPNCFVGGVLVDRSIPGTKQDQQYIGADGIYSRMSTEFGVNVPFSDGTVSTVQTSSSNPVIGHNTRGLQIGDSKQFVQIGYTAGCGSASYDMRFPPKRQLCSGINSSRGVNKMVFVDGIRCSSYCSYWIEPFNVIEGGYDHTYQIQRNYIPSTGQYGWRFFYDGREIWTEYVAGLESGFASMASERLGPRYGQTGNRDLEVNLAMDHFAVPYYHRKGDPSSNPPGTKNYRWAGSSWDPYTHGFLDVKGGKCNAENYQVNQGIRVKGTC